MTACLVPKPASLVTRLTALWVTPSILDLCVVAAYSCTTQLNTSPSGRSGTHTSEPGLSVPGHSPFKVGALLLASDWRFTPSSRAAASYESPTWTSKSLTLGHWALLSRGRSLTPRMCTITYPLHKHCNPMTLGHWLLLNRGKSLTPSMCTIFPSYTNTKTP